MSKNKLTQENVNKYWKDYLMDVSTPEENKKSYTEFRQLSIIQEGDEVELEAVAPSTPANQPQETINKFNIKPKNIKPQSYKLSGCLGKTCGDIGADPTAFEPRPSLSR